MRRTSSLRKIYVPVPLSTFYFYFLNADSESIIYLFVCFKIYQIQNN